MVEIRCFLASLVFAAELPVLKSLPIPSSDTTGAQNTTWLPALDGSKEVNKRRLAGCVGCTGSGSSFTCPCIRPFCVRNGVEGKWIKESEDRAFLEGTRGAEPQKEPLCELKDSSGAVLKRFWLPFLEFLNGRDVAEAIIMPGCCVAEKAGQICNIMGNNGMEGKGEVDPCSGLITRGYVPLKDSRGQFYYFLQTWIVSGSGTIGNYRYVHDGELWNDDHAHLGAITKARILELFNAQRNFQGQCHPF